MKFEIVINGSVRETVTSDTDDRPNAIASAMRMNPAQRVTVYEVGSKKHCAAFAAKLTPTNPEAAVEAPPPPPPPTKK